MHIWGAMQGVNMGWEAASLLNLQKILFKTRSYEAQADLKLTI